MFTMININTAGLLPNFTFERIALRMAGRAESAAELAGMNQAAVDAALLSMGNWAATEYNPAGKIDQLVAMSDRFIEEKADPSVRFFAALRAYSMTRALLDLDANAPH